jgi:hypothetical protein
VLLQKKHIPFIGGEPSTELIFKALEQKGYTPKEIMGLYLVRNIAPWHRQGMLKDRKQFSEIATKFFKSAKFSHVADADKLTLEEFTAWYDKHKSELGNKDYLQLIAKDTNPIYEPDANYFQKMSSIMDAVRDSNVIGTISNTLKKYDKVLVVYGNAHQYTSRPIFEKMFGSEGQIESLILSEHKPAQTTQPTVTTNAPDKTNKRYQLFTAAAGLISVISGAIILKATGVAQKSLAKSAAFAAIVTGGITATLSLVNSQSEEKTTTTMTTTSQNNHSFSSNNTIQSGHVARLEQEKADVSIQR